MSAPSVIESSAPQGFNFENHIRNANLIHAAQVQSQQAAVASGAHHSTVTANATSDTSNSNTAIKQVAKKTGTTICGIVYKNGVVLGADTRSTNGEEVAEKNCEKIHYMAPNIYCCGAGTAADTEKTTELISSQLELLRMETHSESRVVTAMTRLKRMLHRYQGYISAALVLGGVDSAGGHLYQIYPHGSTGRLPYTSMGSGSLAAIAVLETGWKPDMDENAAITLVQRAICAGIFNDLGSGSNCDITVIRQATPSSNNNKTYDVSIHRNMIKPNPVEPLRAAVNRSNRLTITPGLTPVISTTFTPHPTTSNIPTVQSQAAAAAADAGSEMDVEE